MSAATALDYGFYRQQFDMAVQELAGSPQRSLLKALLRQVPGKGDVTYIDAVKPNDAAAQTAALSKATYAKFANDSSQTLAELVATRTPHMDITRERTLSFPTLVEWGYYFDEHDKILEMADPTNHTMRAGMKQMFVQEDDIILDALTAATVTRGNGTGLTETVTFASVNSGSQVLTTKTFNVATLAWLKQRFENQYVNDPIFCVISPAAKRALIVANGSTITSKDFVDSGRFFATGELPDVYGVHLIVHPALTSARAVAYNSAIDDLAIAFTANAAAVVNYGDLRTSLGDSADHRFHSVAYVRELMDCKRVDDLGVVHIKIDAGGISTAS